MEINKKKKLITTIFCVGILTTSLIPIVAAKSGTFDDCNLPSVRIVYPKPGFLYIFNREVLPFQTNNVIIIGWYSTIAALGIDKDGLHNFSLYADGRFLEEKTLGAGITNATVLFPSYLEWGLHSIEVVVTDTKGFEKGASTEFQIFFPLWGAPPTS